MSRQDENDAPTSFKVEDRRRFTDDGTARSDAPDPEPTKTAAPPGNEGVLRGEKPAAAATDRPPLELNFSTFIISLSTQALSLLGEIPDPISQQTNVDLGAARQMIDIVGMLQEKTRGNLDKAEAELIEGLLYDLRLRYVDQARR